MTPEELFYQVFESLPRQGPGCTGATRKAYSYLPTLPKDAKILDIGCGSGTQTRDLSTLSSGTITAVDIHRPFIEAVSKMAKDEGMEGRIKTVCASMDALPFESGQFDIIWSEGAIFIIGFEKGLATWKPLLKKGGYIIVSDAEWFDQIRPGSWCSGGRRRGTFHGPRISSLNRSGIQDSGSLPCTGFPKPVGGRTFMFPC